MKGKASVYFHPSKQVRKIVYPDGKFATFTDDEKGRVALESEVMAILLKNFIKVCRILTEFVDDVGRSGLIVDASEFPERVTATIREGAQRGCRIVIEKAHDCRVALFGPDEYEAALMDIEARRSQIRPATMKKIAETVSALSLHVKRMSGPEAYVTTLQKAVSAPHIAKEFLEVKMYEKEEEV